MSKLKISEAGTVQFPMVKHAEEIGWTVITPQEAEKKRGGEEHMLFRDELEHALRVFNPWMKDDVIAQIIDELKAISPTIEGNRAMLSWLRGKRRWYDEKEKRYRNVQLIDFSEPSKNVFYVTWEWKIKPPAKKGNRADVMFIINGIPVAIIENKNPKDGDAINRAVGQLKRYEMETPELIGAAQLFNVTHLIDYWYGVTWNANRRYMARWKQKPDETYKFAVQSFFEPQDFLRTLEHWILFYVEDGETRKTVLREHQRIAIDKIVERCADTKSRGLIWHTQGSGKTFTLLTAARRILEQKERFKNATVILVVDRIELEGQLKGWVDRLLGEMQQQDIAVWEADSKKKIQELLETDKRGLIISMIHKFEDIGNNINSNDNIFVFVDEAHRSVAAQLGIYMIAAVPNATFIGFTGTPIDRTAHGQGTFAIFGSEDKEGYLHKYSIRESIEDETTLPIRYMMAPSTMAIPKEMIDKEFFAMAETEGIADVEELNRVLDRAVNLRTFLTADERIENVAKFVAEHYKKHVMPLGYKAMLVGVNREACAKYKIALNKHLPPEWSEAIYTQNQADKIDRPVVAEVQLTQDEEDNVRRLFKKNNENPKILIVTDKLLTGYDAPLLFCMYLDKPMRDHVLLQAIARVNRPYIDDNNIQKSTGLVVDFVSVLSNLKKALKFDESDVDGVIEDLDVMLEELLKKIKEAEKEYLETDKDKSSDEQLEQIVYGRFLDVEQRKSFYETYKDIENLWEVVSPAPELRDSIDTYNKLAQLYMVVRNAYRDNIGYLAELAHKTKRLVQENATQKGFGRLTKEVTFNVETLESLKDESGSDERKVFNLVRGFGREIDEKPDMAPVLRLLRDRAEQILKEIEERKMTGLQAMEALEILIKQKEEILKEIEKSGLSNQAFAVYWNLKNDKAIQKTDIQAMDVAREAEKLLAMFPNAAVNPDENRSLRIKLYQPVLSLDKDERKRIVDLITEILIGKSENE